MTQKSIAQEMLDEMGGEAVLDELFKESIQNAIDKLTGKYVPPQPTITRDQGFDTLPAPSLYIGLKKKAPSPE